VFLNIKQIVDFLKIRIKSINAPLLSYLMNQAGFYIKLGKFKSAYNYLWVLATTQEDGAGIFEPIYRMNPDWAPYPGRIELEVSNKCCLRCPKCEHTYWKEKPRNMSLKEVKHILKQFPTLKAVSLTGIGHGFENPEYLKIIKYIKDKEIFTQFYDPFLLINEKLAREIVKLSVDKVIMSIDAATPETYKKLQAGSDFDTVVRNVTRMIEFKNEMNSLFPDMCFQFIVQKPNVEEMPKFIELVDEITKDDPSRFRTVQFIRLIPFKENRYLEPKISTQIYKKTVKKAKELGRFRLTFCNIPDTAKKNPISECTSWRVPFITVEGDYYPCCSLTEQNVRYLVRKQVRWNLFKDDFRDIWYSKEFRKFIWTIKNGGIPPICNTYIDCAIFETFGPLKSK